MIRFFASFMQSLRPLIVVGIAVGFAAVYATHGWPGVWIVTKLVAIGIVMNFAAWLVLRQIWRRKAQGVSDED